MTATIPRPEATGWSATDTAICGVLFAFTCWYCASAPYNLYVYDEGYFLYEAKRLVNGDVFYRDFFDLVTPLGFYVMAAAYWLFGTTMATARTAMAVVHGMIAVGMIVACRRVGVRSSIAAVVALSEAAVCYMANERAAPHWFGTLFCVLVLLALLRGPLRRARHAFLVGTLVGALILSQQQRGMAMICIPIAVLILDRWILVSKDARSWQAVMNGVVAYAAGVGIVVVPVMLGFVMTAGFDNVYTALVRYPLVNYRNVNRNPWGQYNPIQDPYIGPVVKYLSIVIPALGVGRWVFEWRTARESHAVRSVAVAFLTSIGALLGVSYVPGYPYLVLAGPVWFVLLAYLVEVGLRAAADRWPRTHVVAAGLVAAFTVLFIVRLGYRRHELSVQWPYQHDTPFGRMNFASQTDIDVLEAIIQIAGVNQPTFVYPTAPGLYLLTGTENISRFQVLIPGYSSPEHVQEVLDLLERRRQPIVIRNWMWMRNDLDPIFPYLKQHYDKMKLPYPREQIATITLFRRKPDAPTAKSF